LPGTEREILEIKDVMKNSVNRYLLEDRATESAFRRDASNYNIIHLAMHGIADTLDALNSRLVFRRSAEETEDGVLYAHELYDMDMRKLDLAVLSACETGMGKVQKGEGVMSIARGFAYAGCPSLVISLWKIDDLSASHIMGDFYRNLSSGQEIDVSLTNAKADYRRASNEFNSHPSYWAAFLSVGDIRPIRKDRIDLKFWGTTIAGILLLAFGILVLIRARAKTKGFDKGKPSIF
jgi:CHAT domain-containing protein